MRSRKKASLNLIGKFKISSNKFRNYFGIDYFENSVYKLIFKTFIKTMSTFQNPVGWFEIYVSDLARAVHFYEVVFKQELLKMPTEDQSIKMVKFSWDINSYGTNGALVQHPMRQPSTEGVLIYFSCDDCAITEQLAIENNGKIYKPKTGIGANGFISIIGDSEGNAIGLHSLA